MKSYRCEFSKLKTAVVYVDAENESQAEDLASDKIYSSPDVDIEEDDGWKVEVIKEVDDFTEPVNIDKDDKEV